MSHIESTPRRQQQALRYLILSSVIFLSSVRPDLVVQAQDWPQFLGPLRNGRYAGTDLTTVLPKTGPPVVWKKAIGQGFSGPVVAEGKLVLFHRLGDKEVVEGLDAATGKEIWRFEYPTRYRDDFGFDEGPRVDARGCLWARLYLRRRGHASLPRLCHGKEIVGHRYASAIRCPQGLLWCCLLSAC